jgi:hypothetical protein
MRLHGSTVLATLALWLLLPADLLTIEKADPAIQQQRQMELAALYERLHAWDKAEAQFVEATQGPSKDLKEQALQGIERVRKLAARSGDRSSLRLGSFYERQAMWSEAEQHYLTAAKEGSESVQRLALDGLKRVRARIPRNRWAKDFGEWFDISSGLITRGLAVVGALVGLSLALRYILKVRRRIEILPFAASNETAGFQIKYWLGHAQAMIQTAGALPSPAGMTGSLLPYLRLPELAEKLPELGEIAIAGFKVSARELLQGLAQPRVRVSGSWIVGAPNGKTFARFERRRRFSRYESYATIKRDIPGSQQDQELELFAYHILIKAAETYVS